jgi:hypothetical protein
MSHFDNLNPVAQKKDGGNFDERRYFAQSKGVFPRTVNILLISIEEATETCLSEAIKTPRFYGNFDDRGILLQSLSPVRIPTDPDVYLGF